VTPRQVAAGLGIGLLYGAGALLADADMVPGVIGAVLAGVLTVLILRDYELRRRRR